MSHEPFIKPFLFRLERDSKFMLFVEVRFLSSVHSLVSCFLEIVRK
ncbi:hypothetical protein LEP1GSC016_2324 [Leptospira borgpetersenii serovar Hardjo-bovis str. Sponselee]|uniref:Uncharacterized protein n=1 Tax=Leptospira borgpetersenii serovar Hardjo-bovis str. Sponselee TaxID=1303729 RepID=M6BYY4_LEPBO|nr:hypothetical protein LEP1GSC016_2324 [Leptospira borgpetersenii serovar Hardjo-bovis str. Sponselee]